MRVLVVDDDVPFADAVRAGLTQEAIAADVVYDGDAALDSLRIHDYDIVVLDRRLPELHGDEVCRAIVRDHPQLRVLMLTVEHHLEDKLSGFALGADDYLGKPFQFPELVARLRSLARRPTSTYPPVLTIAGVTLDPFHRQVTRDGIPVVLTNKEFAVLQILMEAQGGVVSAEVLLEKAWDVNTNPFTNTVRVTISSLRRKLGKPWAVQTVLGTGYKIAETP